MALTFVAGDKSFSLSFAEIQNWPGSVLHSLVSSVPSDDGAVTLKVDDLPGSPFATWPEAIPATTALYRKQPMSAEVLSDLLKTHTEAQLYSKLKGLLDYLGINTPVTTLLPARSNIPLLHVGVLGLHYYALANKAVYLMMTSTAFSCSSFGTQQRSAAYFYITIKGAQGSIGDIQVYAAGGPRLRNNDPANLQDVPGVTSIKAVGDEITAVALPARTDCLRTPSGGKVYLGLQFMINSSGTYGTGVWAKDTVLGGRIMAVLQAVVGRVSVDGRTGVMRVNCIEANCSPYGLSTCCAPLWVLQW